MPDHTEVSDSQFEPGSLSPHVHPVPLRDPEVAGRFGLRERPHAASPASRCADDIVEPSLATRANREQSDALWESEQRFRDVTELSSDWYWEQDAQYRFTFFSDRFMEKAGFGPNFHLGKCRWEVPALNINEQAWAEHKAALERREPFHDFIICCVGIDGQTYWSSVSGRPVFDRRGNFKGYRGIGRDISESHRREEALLRFRAAIDATADGIHIVDCETLQFIDVNESACRSLGYTRDEFLALHIEDIEPGVDLARLAQLHGELFTGVDIERSAEIVHQHRNGGQIPIEIRRRGAVIGGRRVAVNLVRDILQRKTDEAALRESEARFRSLTELSSDWYWEQDQNFRFTSRSGGLPQHAVLRPDADHGKTRWELPLYGVSDAQWKAHRETLEAHRPFRDFTYQRRDGHGQMRHVCISGHPVVDEQGRFRGYRGIGKDVTASKRAEELLGLEHAVARCLADADDASPALRAVIQAVCETENWEHGAYWQADEAAGLMRLGEVWHVPGDELEQYTQSSRGVTFGPGLGLVGTVWQSGDPLWVQDFGRDPRVLQKSLTREISMRGMFVFPVKSDGGTIGVFAFFSREVREPDGRLLAAARVIGSQVGQFLHRKHREEALRESEARFRGLCELSSDWYWEQDADLRFTVMSGGFMNKGNFRVDKAIGLRRWELPVERDGSDWAAHQATLEAHLPFTDFEYRIRTEDGGMRHYSVRGEPLFDGNGEFKGYRGVANDITKRKQHDEELRRFRAAMDTSADAILLADRASMRYIDVNNTACEMLGYSRQELLALGPQDTMPFTREQLERNYDDLIAGGSAAMQSQTTGRRKDGSLMPVEVSRRAIRSGEGWIIVGIARDISARLTAEQTIRRHAMQQSLIAAFGQKALANVDLDELPNQVADVAALGLGVDFSNVLRLEPDGRSLVLRAGVGWHEGWLGRRIAEVDGGTPGDCVLAIGEPLIVEDFESEGAATPSQMLVQHGIRSGVCVPIHGVGGPYGVLGAYSTEPGWFTQESVNFMQSLANTLATAVDRKGAEQRLTYLAQFDTLTGLANRSLFLDRFAQALKQAQRNQWMVGVLFIDLDRFKVVNDTLGHATGDQLLIEVAERLQKCVRADDAVGRLGGDEFAFVLSNLTRPDDAALVAQKVVAALARPFTLEGQEIYISASLGIGVYPSDGSDADTLLRNADTAMYRAKERGRNGYQFYLPQMNELALERLQLQTQLRGALERHEFVLHYQPKACLASGRISGFEALLRWQHPVHGLVPPLQFIAILEETGLIIPVGEWVVRAVCEQLAQWQAAGVTPRPVAINLSARQFQQRNLDTTIAAILAETGIDPGLLELELTESMLMSDAEEAVRMLNTMRSYGVRLSVDDFGTGYSSLAYLKRFALDALKIDRAFIRDVTTDPDDASIALAIISLAHSLKLKVVAEGVETEAQLQFLREHDCDEMQGFYFSRPLAAVDCIRAMTEDWRL